ncbi:MAG: amidohydrolase family protein [Bacteroidetes bacterium]|jgi:5-methylthioadenosine/S-adenosylhomocysteine deaminase|nr:amidohydrolase family protein [Bacteroidota bacterium]
MTVHDTVKIIDRVYVLACDSAGSGGLSTVVIRNDRISAIGPVSQAFQAQFPNAERIDGSGRVLLPGFIDAHYHGESSLLSLLTAGAPASQWGRLKGYRALDDHLRTKATHDDWLTLYRAAYFHALRAGVTTVAEYGRPDTDAAFAASIAAFHVTSLRGMLCVHNGDQLESLRSARSSSMAFSLALPASEELTTYNLQTTMRLAREHGLPIAIHMGETARDAEAVRKNFRKSFVDVLNEFRVIGAPNLAIHFSAVDKDEAARLHASGASIAVSPLASTAKGFEPPPIALLMSAGIPTVLVTDWGPVRPWQNVRQALQWYRAPAMDLLRQHTLLAAQYLGVGQELGSVTVGKKADLVMLRSPFADMRAALQVLDPATVAELLVERIGESDITDVMVNGEFYVREGTIMMYAEEDLASDLRRLLAFAPLEVQTGQAPPAVPVEPAGAERGEEENAEFEEGFKIVKRPVANRTAGPILPLHPKAPPAQELPPTVRRVFGEDDV